MPTLPEPKPAPPLPPALPLLPACPPQRQHVYTTEYLTSFPNWHSQGGPLVSGK